ncbi:hypothetical protein GGQ73_003179 [Rhizobium skierniewicense]|uniref:Uncharacterized protein n=1 Tax=Rhizobium skierniewicense TaxID=984260 RepID=A0A7W6C7K9_9HYPH|nr:hypothetical protein [Rhizobium skierniewicense]MBB3947213.1 hypothetical protein [Rhizobium skierniewicense]
MTGGVADGSGFSAAEIDAMTIDELRFWWNCIMAYRNHVSEMSKP